jgi:hypothetical protein
MIRPEVQFLAEEAGYDAVAFELGEAKARSESGLYTEAVMRLGRATEATLYAVAREFGIQFDLQILKLRLLQNDLRGIESRILKTIDVIEVGALEKLANEDLPNVINQLKSDEMMRRGKSGDSPQGVNSILRDLIATIVDDSARRRLKAKNQLLSSVMKARNTGAHASLTGDRRETDPECFPQLASDFQDFIQALIEVAVGERAHRMMLATTTVNMLRQ